MSTFASAAVVYTKDGKEVIDWDSAELMNMGIDYELIIFLGAMTGESRKGQYFHPAFKKTTKFDLIDSFAKELRRAGFNEFMNDSDYILKIADIKRFVTEKLCHNKEYTNPCMAIDTFSEDFVKWLGEIAQLEADFLVLWVSP